MPQPPRNDELAAQLIRQYEAAHESLVAQLQAVIDEPARARQTARLRELIRSNEAIVDGLTDATRTWLGATVPQLHQAGATAAAEALGTRFAWTAPHLSAVQSFAERTFDDVATRLRQMRASTRRELRSWVEDATRASLLESRTAVSAGRDLARVAADHGLFSVEYSNGARHTVRDYADSVIRTTTATAYNQGSLEQCRSDGIDHVEYADGPGCCVGPGHKVGPEANGLVVPLDQVVFISHPRCRRALLPAPDGTPLPDGNRNVGPERPSEPTATPKPTRAPREPRTARAPRVEEPATPEAPGTVHPRTAFRFPAKDKERVKRFEDLLDQIGEIHDMAADGFPQTEVVLGRNKGGSKGGHFSPKARATKPRRTKGEAPESFRARLIAWRDDVRPELRVNDIYGPDQEAMTFIHELGHRLDAHPGQGGFFTETAGRSHSDPEVTSAIQAFLEAARATSNIADAKVNFAQAPGFAAYHRDPREIWARAYSQWMAGRLGGAPERGLQLRLGLHPHLQWPEDEFSTLAPLVENVLRAMGLMK